MLIIWGLVAMAVFIALLGRTRYGVRASDPVNQYGTTMKEIIMKRIGLIFTCLVLVFASLMAPAFAGDDSKRIGGKNEALGLEKLPQGYLIALRQIPTTGTQYLRMAIKLKGYDTTSGGFIAVGMGDLYRFYENGQHPLGEGYLLGYNNACPSKGVAVTLYSYTDTLPINCRNSSPILNDMIIQIYVSVTAKGDVNLTVENAYDFLITRLSKPAVSVAQYSKGFFIVPIGTGSYELLSLSAGTE